METIDLATLTIESFKPLVGEPFALATPGGAIGLTLVSTKGHGWSRPAEREAFTLTFLGPRDPLLPQSMYSIESERLGRIENLFLVPVGRDATSCHYEAVFT